MPVIHSPEDSGDESLGYKGQNDTQITNPFLGFEDEEAPMDPAVKKELEALFRQRQAVRQKLVRIIESLLAQQRSGQLLSLAQLNVMDRNLTSIYQEFNTFHNTVMALIPDAAVIVQDAIYADFEKSHNETAATVQELLLVAKNTAAPPAAPQIIVKQQPLKAPIPTFDGTYSMWPKFKAIFEDLMASAGDTDALKLYHLDKALIGDAAGVLDAKVMAEGDYQRAWAILTERFENKRVIVECHIRGLLSLKKMTSESYKELRALLDEVVRHVEGLRYQEQQLLGVSEHIIVYLIAAALDKPTRKAWEGTQKKGELPKYEPTIKFLKSRCQVLENCETANLGQAQPAKPKSVSQPSARAQPQKSHAATTSTGYSATNETCDVCSGSHRSFQCPVLDKLAVAQRNEKVKAAGICFNCLRKGHRSSDCQSKQSCKKCQRRHHTMLHEEKTPPSNVTVPTGAEGTSVPAIQTTANPGSVVQQAAVESPSVSSTCNCARAGKTVLLLTAVVHALDRNGQPHPCRVLLDSGAQVNFVSEKMVNLLGLHKQHANVPITGINALRTHAREKVLLKFRSRVSSFHANVECLVTRRVTGTIPTSKIDVCQWGLPDGLQLADPEFHTPGEVDLLIGAELFFDFFKTGQLSLADNLPQLRDTHLGWIVTGVVKEPFIASPALHCNTTTIADVENMMQRFWQIEEVPDVPKQSDEELACEAHFLSTYKRDTTGRFVVRLPLKDDISKLNDCHDLALKRFLMLEGRLQRNPDLQQQYVEFVREYETLGHCHEVKEADDPPGQVNYHMPHHAVLRPSSSSTKCRVVFDASAKTSPDSLSLNEVLRIGAVVQALLFSIVLRFRKYKVAFTTDIIKMYRQIRMSPEDTHYQRIFWREQPSQPIRVLELDTVTYGTASAPYQATRCLVQLAEEEADHFPVAARILKQEVYMDDILSGADTLEEAIEAQVQLKTLLGRGGFPVHKWCSNSKEFLMNVPPEDREKQVPIEENAANEVIKVLGLLWDSTADTFLMAHQASSEPPAEPITKRKIYAEVARFYDPLGLFSPAIVLAKLLAQQLWKLNAGWDDPVNDEVSQRWQELTRSLRT